MGMVAGAGAAVQQLFGPLAAAADRDRPVVVRRRTFTPASLARTFVLGFLQNPDASAEELAQVAAQCGAAVTPQAIDQRQTPRLVGFLEDLFRRAVRVVVGSDRALAPLLERFTAVTLLDSTVIELPDGQRDRFPGCGGRCGFGQAAVKLQTELDLRTGGLQVAVEPGRAADVATDRQQTRRGPGALRITDLGYFCLAVFAALVGAGEHFLSRLQFGAGVRPPGGPAVDLLRWLAGQPDRLVDRPVELGLRQRLPARLIAWRVPPAQADRRRHKLRAAHRRKWGREPTAERLGWCGWTILVTSVPAERLSAAEAIVLYRARWQVELLFKRWKSQDRVAALTGSTEVRQMVRVWGRLLAAVVRHWLVVATAWGDPTRSWAKAAAAVGRFVGRIAAGLDRAAVLAETIAALGRVVTTTCRRNRRAKAGTVELLNDPGRLDFGLT
jgi:Transposase DDE domain